MQQRLTAMFIEADPVEIQLLRRTKAPDGAGGFTTTDAVAFGGLQRFRLIPLGDGATERYTEDGHQVFPNYMLMGPATASMQRWDEFELDGRRYQIVFINQNSQYEIKGEVAYLG